MRGFSLHWHERMEIAYVLKGGLVVSVEGRAYEAAPGDLVIINSGAVHGFSRSAPDTSIILLQFGLELFEECLVDLRDKISRQLVFDRKTLVTADADGDVQRRLELLVFEMHREFTERKEGYRLAVKARLYDFAILLLRQVPARQVSAAKLRKRVHCREILERIINFIHDGYARQITLDQAAESAALSKFYFTRFFREQTGQTFHSYLARVRVGHAEELLAGSDLTITEVAYRCGFVSRNTFNRLFRTYTGATPYEYRSGERAKTGQFLDQSGQ
jgi:AraC-like DNA-binding protein